MIRSILARLQRRKAGQSRSAEKVAAARKNLPAPRTYNLTTPTTLLESLEDADKKALDNLFESTRALAVPFNDGNTNALGQLPCLQQLVAKKKLRRLGLPDEVEPRALQFLEGFVREGINEKTEEENHVTDAA
jgi:hypothetical protein